MIGAGVMAMVATGHSTKFAGWLLAMLTLLAEAKTCAAPGSLAVAVLVVVVVTVACDGGFAGIVTVEVKRDVEVRVYAEKEVSVIILALPPL